MSEEAKYVPVDEWLKLHKHEFEGNDSASGAIYIMHWGDAMEAYAEYRASQVCEQRDLEKQHWQGQKRNYDALVGKIQAIVHKFHGKDERWSDFDVLDQGVSLISQRAEAAELALQQIKENDRFTYCAYCNARFEVDKSGQLVADHIRTCDKHPIGAALQAKEQELRKELDVPLCGDCAESWFTMRDNLPRKDGCVFCASVAQARQQAVADLRNVLIAIPISNELRGNRYDCEDTHTLHIWSPPLDKSWDVIIPKVKP